MKISELDEKQISETYCDFIIPNFPRNERRPLKNMIGLLHDGKYTALGAFDENDTIIGVAYLVRSGNIRMLDYLAVRDDMRNHGIGAGILSALREYCADDEYLILETEDPDRAKTEDEKTLQNRRLNFYLRNGFIFTGVRVKLFGAYFRIMSDRVIDDADIEKMKEHYLLMYSTLTSRHILLHFLKFQN